MIYHNSCCASHMLSILKVVYGSLFLAAGLTAGDSVQAYKAVRTSDGKPDLAGIWQSLNTANWDIQGHAASRSQVVALGAAGAVPAGLGVVEGNEIPYLPADRKSTRL